jgi:hypothetical protein
VRDRRSRSNARAGTLAGSFGSRLLMQMIDRPVDSFAILIRSPFSARRRRQS